MERTRPPTRTTGGASASGTTIYDIARETGFSASTVSRALSTPGRLSATTEKTIREAAQRLGYRTNPIARALLTGQTNTLALILSDITNPVYFDLVRGAERVTSKAHYTLVLAESQESAALEETTLDRLTPSVDGYVLVGSRMPDAAIQERASSKPLVTVNRLVDGVVGVAPDPRQGVVEALDHLATLGHRRLAYLSGPPSSWMNQQRWDALLETAERRGLFIVEIGHAAPTFDGGQGALRHVTAAGVSAVIAYNDLMAIGLQQACQAGGIDIPRQLSIIGFDDIFGASFVSPPLTTIRSPLGAAGAAAVELLLSRIGALEGEPASELATEFVPRGSTGKAALT